MLDQLRKGFFSKTLNAYIAKCFGTNAATDWLSRKRLTLRSIRALIRAFVRKENRLQNWGSKYCYRQGVKEGTCESYRSICRFYRSPPTMIRIAEGGATRSRASRRGSKYCLAKPENFHVRQQSQTVNSSKSSKEKHDSRSELKLDS